MKKNTPKSIMKYMIEESDIQIAAEQLNEWSINDIVKILQIYPQHATKIIKLLETHKAASVFKLLDISLQKDIINIIPHGIIIQLLNNLPVNDRVAFLEELPKHLVKEMIKYLNPEEKLQTIRSLGYPENSVGRLMIPDYINIRNNWTVQEVLNHIRHKGKNNEMIEVIYVVNEQGQLIDDVRIREFLLVDPSTKVVELMDGRYISLSVTDTEEEAIKVFNTSNRVALPVIDDQNFLLGIVSIDNVLWVANENYSEDIQKMGGMEALNQPYLDVPFLKLVKKRAGWLILLFLSEMFTTAAMQYFSNALEKVLVLATFIPLVVSSGGNSGSQAASLIIQAMALREVRLKNWWQIMRREFSCGLALGCILGGVGFIRIILWQRIGFYNYGNHWFLIACTVAFSLVGIVLWGTFSGSMLPIVIKCLGGDPASSSTPFVATLVDVTGIIIYFSSAYIFLKGTLL